MIATICQGANRKKIKDFRKSLQNWRIFKQKFYSFLAKFAFKLQNRYKKEFLTKNENFDCGKWHLFGAEH